MRQSHQPDSPSVGWISEHVLYLFPAFHPSKVESGAHEGSWPQLRQIFAEFTH